MPLTLTVTPEYALVPTEISICASGCEPGGKVHLKASLRDDAGVDWQSDGHFIADASGNVDVHSAPSESGTFAGIDPAGLFWSMRPLDQDLATFQLDATERPHKLGQPVEDPLKPRVISFSAEVDGTVRATSAVTLCKLDPAIETFEVRVGNLRGMAFRWKDRSPKRGGIMSLTGSGGGVEMNYAPLLASLGYDVFSLAYFAYEDLPSAIINIPLEYFAEGFEWMKTHFGSEKIAVQGASRGGELSVLLAATFPQYVKGAIPIVAMYATSPGWDPSDGVEGPSWTFAGEAIPYPPAIPSTSLEDMQTEGRTLPNGFPLTPWYRALMSQPEAMANCSIAIENAGGPILMVSGVEDEMWPCAWGSDRITDRLRARDFQHSFSHLALRETGHITPLPNQITTFNSSLVHSLTPIRFACGGTAQGSARNSRLFWDAMVAHYQAVFGH